MTKIDRSKYEWEANKAFARSTSFQDSIGRTPGYTPLGSYAYNYVPPQAIQAHNRIVTELCDAYDALAADPRLSLVATAERPQREAPAIRICLRSGLERVVSYNHGERHEGDSTFGYSKSRWLTLAALHAAFPYVAPPDPRIAELAALKAKVAALEAEIVGAA